MSERPDTPVFTESIGGALIDSARISVMAAMHVLPNGPVLIELPDDPPALHDCLAQAMEWLNAARAQTIQAQPPTSLHVVDGVVTP